MFDCQAKFVTTNDIVELKQGRHYSNCGIGYWTDVGQMLGINYDGFFPLELYNQILSIVFCF